MQEITVTPLEALAQLTDVAILIDTFECKDNGIYNRLQGALGVAQTVLAMAPKQEAPEASNFELQKLKDAAKRAGMAGHFIDGKLRDDMFIIGRDFIDRLHAELTKFCPPIAAPAAANGAPEGYVMVPLKPTPAMIKAMAESRATDDEGVFPAMLDLLDFSGENKTRTVLEAAYVAALSGAKGN